MTKGLLIVYTGAGKGKTCAAFGQALRAVGQDLRVCIIQFIKSRPSGELTALRKLSGQVEIHQVGSGFSWQDQDLVKFRESARTGWQLAAEKITAGSYDLIILDELTYLLNFAILEAGEVLPVLRGRPAAMHLVITGRNAAPELLAAADLVTEMREIKHHFKQGVIAQKGIEW